MNEITQGLSYNAKKQNEQRFSNTRFLKTMLKIVPREVKGFRDRHHHHHHHHSHPPPSLLACYSSKWRLENSSIEKITGKKKGTTGLQQ